MIPGGQRNIFSFSFYKHVILFSLQETLANPIGKRVVSFAILLTGLA